MMNIPIEIYKKTFEELNSVERTLVEKSREASLLSYSPYSKFKVGCAIRLSNNQIVLGANQENASYPICICAEGITLGAVATQYPKEKIVDVAIFVDIEGPASPCGLCRQTFSEYESRMNSKFNYYLVSREFVYTFVGIENLLPLSFGAKDLV